MANVATQNIVRAGVNPTYTAASAGGDQVRPGPSTFLHVKNASAASVTVTIVTHKTVEGLDLADLPVAVPAGGERMIGPVNDLFLDPADGLADITWSAAASVTFAVITA
jgi:Trk K+ transport system NAD-binding subunit